MKTKPHNKLFGQNLRNIRLSKNKTQDELAFDAGLDRTYIGLLENGHSSPTLDTIVALASALDIESALLLNDVA